MLQTTKQHFTVYQGFTKKLLTKQILLIHIQAF